MPFKFIIFIVVLVVIVTFIGINLDHKADIQIWFGEKGTISGAPVFVIAFVAYLAGLLTSLPFYIGYQIKKYYRQSNHEDEQDDSKISRRILGKKSTPEEDEQNH